jgi:hypothetical protein
LNLKRFQRFSHRAFTGAIALNQFFFLRQSVARGEIIRHNRFFNGIDNFIGSFDTNQING